MLNSIISTLNYKARGKLNVLDRVYKASFLKICIPLTWWHTTFALLNAMLMGCNQDTV